MKSRELNPVETKIVRELSKKKPKKGIVKTLRAVLPDFLSLRDAAERFQRRLQPLCLECSRVSDDDNLSRSGQTFVSIDAMATVGLAASGADPAADLPGDDAPQERLRQTASDYLSRNALVPDSSPSESATSLPSDVEDVLRRNLKDFCELSHFEKMLILSQWSGESFSKFGTMKLVPRELKRPQSKQLISQRWNKLCLRFPLAAALKSAVRPGRKPLSPADYAAVAASLPPRRRGRKPKAKTTATSRFLQADFFQTDPTTSPRTATEGNATDRISTQGRGTATQRNVTKGIGLPGVGEQLRNPIAHIGLHTLLTRLSTFASTANFLRGETPRDGVFGRESSRTAFANAV